MTRNRGRLRNQSFAPEVTLYNMAGSKNTNDENSFISIAYKGNDVLYTRNRKNLIRKHGEMVRLGYRQQAESSAWSANGTLSAWNISTIIREE